MAKFYQRYFPVPPISQVQYGYRGSNYTVNGQQYDNITNLQLVGNYQITCSIGDCNAYVSNFSVDSLFEPSLMGSIYDLSGSRFSGDYTAGTFNSSNTTYIGVNNWSFKNHGFCNIVNYTVQTSNSCPAFTGCVTSNNTCINPPCYCYFGTTRACCWVYPASAFSGLYCCNLNNFVQIEAPSGTINNFVPVTTPTLGAGGLHYYWGGTTIISAACAVLEPTSGDSCQGFYPSKCGIGIVDMGGCTQCWWGWSDHCCQFFGAESSCVGDAVYFGGKYNHLCSNANGGQWCAQHIWGSHPVYNGSGGTAEYGMRTFITRSGTKTWYFHYNSANGGIQGSDTSASTLNRLSLRLFDSSNNTTTISNTFLKGLSGLVIPSQPDQDDGTGYRYYFIRFNGTDVKTITIYRILHTYASSVTTTTAYSLSMSSGEQAAIYTNAGHDNTYFSKLNNPAFRRQNVQRIWYSIDSNSVKRLHLGIYNTNGTQLVVGSSGFNDANSTGAMFKIYSWSLDDGASGATYLGNISLHTIGPRYFCPLNTNWTVIYMGSSFGNDAVYTLNATT
jgi:hypothetical protein